MTRETSASNYPTTIEPLAKTRWAIAAAIRILVVVALAFAANDAVYIPRAGAVTTHPPLLVSQTPFVIGDGPQNFVVRIQDAGTTALEVTVFPRLRSRSAFLAAASGALQGNPLRHTTFPVDTTAETASIDLPVAAPGAASLSTTAGVYPVRIGLPHATDTANDLVAFLIRVPATSTSPLSVALIIDIHERPALKTDGTLSTPRQTTDDVRTLAAALAAHPLVPVALRPIPETLNALGSNTPGTTPDASNSIAALRQAASNHTILAGPFVDADSAVLSISDKTTGTNATLDKHLRRSDAVLERVLGTPGARRLWRYTGIPSATSVEALRERGFDQLILNSTALSALSRPAKTLTAPVELKSAQSISDKALVVDSDLGGHLNGGTNAIEDTNRLLADLAMIWLDSPNSKVQRVVAVTTSSKWRPNADQLEVLLGSLERFPVTKAVSLGEAFNVESRTVRSLAPKPPLKISGAVLNARQRLSGFTRLIPNDNPLLNSFLDRMLIADSADLTRAQRDGYATSVSDGINGQLALITMPSFRSVTFTATSDELPVSIQNRTGYPVRVVLEVKGDRVRLPNGHKVALTLDKEVTTTRLRLVARTSGSFPIIVRLTSPDGSVLLQQSQVDVRIAATSAAGLILTIGAALVLAWWWGRHTWRNRPGRYRKGSAAIEVHSD